jgi:hypothetical protein
LPAGIVILVGIGTTSPIAFNPSLTIEGTDPGFFISNSAATDFYSINVQSGVVSTWVKAGADFAIGRASGITGAGYSESLRIDSSGRLLVGTSSAYGSARIQARTTGSAATDGSLTLVTVAAAGGDAPNAPYAVTRAVYGSACNSGATETIRTLASREIAFIKIFYSWPAGTPEWKTGAYDYNGSTVSTNWFHESNAGHAFTLGVSGGVLTLTQSVGVTMNMVIEIEYIDSSGLD